MVMKAALEKLGNWSQSGFSCSIRLLQGLTCCVTRWNRIRQFITLRGLQGRQTPCIVLPTKAPIPSLTCGPSMPWESSKSTSAEPSTIPMISRPDRRCIWPPPLQVQQSASYITMILMVTLYLSAKCNMQRDPLCVKRCVAKCISEYRDKFWQHFYYRHWIWERGMPSMPRIVLLHLGHGQKVQPRRIRKRPRHYSTWLISGHYGASCLRLHR